MAIPHVTPKRKRLLREFKSILPKMAELKKDLENFSEQAKSLPDKDSKWLEEKIKEFIKEKFPEMAEDF
jgi:hypothetical protein